jgi:hypothetical protein
MAVAPADTLDYAWPTQSSVRDLAYARILPIRQSIGQFLSRYDLRQLTDGLKRVVVSYEAVHTAEGRALMRWVRGRLVDCGLSESELSWEERILPHKEGICFGLSFEYRGAKQFAWRGNCDTGVSHFCADLGTGVMELPSHIQLLSQENALSEAMYF